MKALVYDRYGKAEDVLKLTDVPEPEPGPGEVKVKMLLSPINPSDIFNTIEGTYKNAMGRAIWNYGKSDDDFTIDPQGIRPIRKPPQVPGLEGVGIVVKAGEGFLPKLRMNKRVAVIGSRLGSWQEYTVVDAKQVFPISSSVSDEQAAVSFINPVTAYVMVREVLGCGNGDYLMQSAGNSEVGKMIIKMGKKFGYKTINLIRNKDQEAGLKALGADHVIDITTQNLQEQIVNITDGQGVKYALDPISGSLASSMIQCLGLNGQLVIYGTLSSEPLNFSSRDLMTPVASLQGFFLTNYMGSQGLLKKLFITSKVGKLIKSGELQSTIHKVVPMENFKDAIATVRAEGNKGKVLIKLD